MDHHYVVGVNTELGPEEWKRDPATILALLLSEISWLAFRTPLKTDRMCHSIRGVKMTPTSRRCDKIGLPVEGLIFDAEIMKFALETILCCILYNMILSLF